MTSKKKRYKVEATPSFRRMLKKLSYETQRRTLEKLKELETRPHSFKSLHGSLAGRYAIRIGDYRAIYTLDNDKRRIVLHTVAHRRIVYKRS